MWARGRCKCRSVATLCEMAGEAVGVSSFSCSLPAPTTMWSPGAQEGKSLLVSLLAGGLVGWGRQGGIFCLGHEDKACWLSPPGSLLQRSLHRPKGLQAWWPCPALPLRSPLRLHVVPQTNGAAYATLLPITLLGAFLLVYTLVLPERRLPKAGPSRSLGTTVTQCLGPSWQSVACVVCGLSDSVKWGDGAAS